MKARKSRRVAAVAIAVAAALFVTPAAGIPVDGTAAREDSRVVYAGYGVQVWRASGQLDRLAETSPAFRRIVRRQLDFMWREYNHSAPACAQAPLVRVKEYRPRVAFISNQGTFPGGPGDAPDFCANGGAFRFYVKRDGEWRAPIALAGQDLYWCRDLRRWDIPRMSGSRQCWNGHDVVRWDP